jgi:hypothetical protein
LTAWRGLYGTPPSPAARLDAVTSLAEGADMMFAREAVALGYRLVCPLPFALAEYEKDFTPPSGQAAEALESFRQILSEAAALGGLELIALDGRRSAEGAAYAAAGRAVVERADLILAIWDGEPAAGPGGTAETVTTALAARRPVLRLDPWAPSDWVWLGQDAVEIARAAADQPEAVAELMRRAMGMGIAMGMGDGA